MTISQNATIQNVNGTAQHIVQDIPNDYTGIYIFSGTIFILTIIGFMIAYKISEKWRIDNFLLKKEEINQSCASMKELSTNLKEVKKMLEGLNGNNNIINSKQS